jgi:hypothetical protein
MLAKFRGAGVEECVQHYARHDMGLEDARELVPVREEAVVDCIASLLRVQDHMRKEIGGLRAALGSAEERLTESEERTRNAEDRSDLLARAFSVLENDTRARKRGRGE